MEFLYSTMDIICHLFGSEQPTEVLTLSHSPNSVAYGPTSLKVCSLVSHRVGTLVLK